MGSAPVDETTGMPLPTRKSVRQMRWFEHSFWARMAAMSAQIGVDFHISDRLLADTFLSWHRVFDSQTPASRMVRRSYVSFVAGTMLHELLRKKPVSVHQKTGLADPRTPACCTLKDTFTPPTATQFAKPFWDRIYGWIHANRIG